MKLAIKVIAVLALFLFVQAAQAQWTPAKRITWTSGGSHRPAAAIDSANHIHVVWHDDTSGNNEIYYRGSANGGTTWSAVNRLTWTSGTSYYPAIATDSTDTIHIVWMDNSPGNYDIYYKRSVDGGLTWSGAKRLTSTSASCWAPAIAIGSGNTIHVVWNDWTPGNDEIYYRGSPDGGLTWGTVKRLTWTSGNSWYSAIAISSDDKIHIVWTDYTSGNPEIYYKRSANGGLTWGTIKRLTLTSGDSEVPALAIDSNGYIHVVWYDDTPGNHEIYYKQSKDGGATWSAVKRLTLTSGYSISPVIAINSSDSIHIVWPDTTPGGYEIYYKKSADEGTTWSAIQRLTWTSGGSVEPAIAIDSTDIIHVVWQDNTPGNYEIYYLKGN